MFLRVSCRNMGDSGAPAALVLDGEGSIWWASRNLTSIDTGSGNITASVPGGQRDGRAGPGGCNAVVLPRDGLAVVFGQAGGVTAFGV